MNQASNPDFCITIDFDKNSENPSRVFQAMTDLIQSFQSLDCDLIKGIDSQLEPVILLEDIQIGSLKTWLSSSLKGIPDDALKAGDWKKILGHYLVKAKYIIINKLENRTDITDASTIDEIRRELHNEAVKTDIKSFPYYEPIPVPKLINSIDNINKSLSHLSSKDKVLFQGDRNDVATFNMSLNFSPESIENLLTKEVLSDESSMILKVKKPDYLGTSMWDFKYGNKTIQAKFSDRPWLIQFQQRKIDIRTGDSIKAKVITSVKYGHDNSILNTSYEITNVIEILPMNDLSSINWLDEEGI